MKKAELMEEFGVAELKDMARELEIAGFSTMNKEELAVEISKIQRKAEKAEEKEGRAEAKDERKAAKAPPEPPKARVIRPGKAPKRNPNAATGPRMRSAAAIAAEKRKKANKK